MPTPAAPTGAPARARRTVLAASAVVALTAPAACGTGDPAAAGGVRTTVVAVDRSSLPDLDDLTAVEATVDGLRVRVGTFPLG